MVKIDSLGRRNHGFSHIKRCGINAGYFRVGEHQKMIGFRASQEDNDTLEELAAKRGISKSELIRIYMTWGIELDQKEMK